MKVSRGKSLKKRKVSSLFFFIFNFKVKKKKKKKGVERITSSYYNYDPNIQLYLKLGKRKINAIDCVFSDPTHKIWFTGVTNLTIKKYGG